MRFHDFEDENEDDWIMHEMSIAQSVIGTVLKEREARGLGTVTCVRLRIGRMSGVLPDALHFAWELATADTELSGAALEVAMTEACFRCAECSNEIPFDDAPEQCPRCGSTSMRLDGGTDLVIDSLDVEEDNDGQG